jgi:hypothetical protein
LFNDYVKQESVKDDESEVSHGGSSKRSFTLGGNNAYSNTMYDTNKKSTVETIPNSYFNLTTPRDLLPFNEERGFFNRFHANDIYPYIMDSTCLPMVSPINPSARLYPTSTRNYFNIDLLNSNYDNANKEINLTDKIVINDPNNHIEADDMLKKENEPEVKESLETSFQKKNHKPKLSLEIMNDSETTRIFASKVASSIANVNNNTNPTIINNNDEKENVDINLTKPRTPTKISSTSKGVLNVSPKSAFVHIKK